MASTSLPAWQTALEAEAPAPSLRRIVIASVATVTLGFGGFFGWACTAKLDSAVPATGSIVVQSKRKTVSILDGGILKELAVKEGDRVAAGQLLLRLDDTQAQAQVGQLRAQYWTAAARAVRLRAEQADQRGPLAFPADLLDAAAGDPAVAAIVANERQLFDDRWRTYEGTLAVQQKKIAQANEQIGALRAQGNAMSARLRLTEEELRGVNELLSKGYAPRNKVLELQRQTAELRGNIGAFSAKEAEARQVIAQTELEMISTRNTRRSDVSKDLQDAQAQLADLSERLKGAQDVVQHKEITAPESGTVTDIKFFTPGSSISPGQPILDIVPLDDRLVVEANVRPGDIEHVHAGQRVNVRLTAYKQRKVPVLTGRLTYVSADRQQDQKGEPFFLARAELDPGVLSGLKGVELYPGMPAEMLIVGGERLAIDYFISPITDGFRRSFVEE
jgi:HlyD family secretion protein